MEKRKQTLEERMLGLNPENYTKVPFNPAKIKRLAPGDSVDPLESEVEKMRKENPYQADQMEQVDPQIDESSFSPERKRMREKMRQKMMGLTDEK